MRNEIKVMQVLRVPPLGKLVVEVNKQRYEGLAELPDENVRRLVMAAIGELISFAGGYETLVDADVAPPLGPSARTTGPLPALETGPSSEDQLRAQQQAEFLAALEAERDALKEAPPKPPEPSVASGLRRSKPDTPTPDPASSEVNIVGQIDALLQKYVSADPDLVQRSIHLEQGPSGGLRIKVDGEYYGRPAEIKEQKIQIYIKRALKEWESS